MSNHREPGKGFPTPRITPCLPLLSVQQMPLLLLCLAPSSLRCTPLPTLAPAAPGRWFSLPPRPTLHTECLPVRSGRSWCQPWAPFPRGCRVTWLRAAHACSLGGNCLLKCPSPVPSLSCPLPTLQITHVKEPSPKSLLLQTGTKTTHVHVTSEPGTV